jgi:glucose-1-phosphate thymidylyltransferase
MREEDQHVDLDEQQRAAADAGIKSMIPIGRPFLDYVLTALADAGYRAVCLVIGPEHDVIRDYYRRQMRPRRLDIDFAIQPEAKGTADAVAAAEPFAASDPFLMINGDNFYPQHVYEQMRQQPGSAVALFEQQALIDEGNIPAERIAGYALGQIDDRGCLRRIVEKPNAAQLAAIGPPYWVSMNVWKFEPSIFMACRSITPSIRGEYEIVSAVQYAMEQLNVSFRVVPVHAGVLDLSRRRDIASVAARLGEMEVRL